MKCNINTIAKKRKLIRQKLTVFLLTSAIFCGMGCEQFVAIDPPKSELVTVSVFQSSSTANAAMTTVYSIMFSDSMPFRVAFNTGLSADELENYSGISLPLAFYTNSLDAVNNAPRTFWNNFYKYIYQANSIIEGCTGSTTLRDDVKKLLIAESKFIRAFSYFYLVNLYGDVPLLLTTNYQVNAVARRTPGSEVYNQIIADLNESIENLPINYVDGSGVGESTERVRPNRYTALAFLARVYLYLQEYANAEAAANQVINHTALYDIVGLDNVFLMNSREAIWQLPASSTNISINTMEGNKFILMALPTNSDTGALSSNFLKSVDPNDLRLSHWVGIYTHHPLDGPVDYHFPYKYKMRDASQKTEYSMVLRLAEQYLIRAEARVMQGDMAGAQADLNLIRERAGLSPTTASTQHELLDGILHERQVELFTEGHRWFDLKRSANGDSLLEDIAVAKNTPWNPSRKLWPIAQTELERGLNLVQNPGYN